jgi:hypothetical protein
MASLLIDFDNIVKPNKLALLESRVQPIPETMSSLGLVLAISQQQYKALEYIPKGKGRVDYINSPEFVKSITGHAYLIYDKKKRVCEIMGIEGAILAQIIQNALSSIPNDVTLWVGIVLEDQNLDVLIEDYIAAGFHDPYICKASPLGFAFNGYGLCMFRQNDIVDKNVTNDVTNDVTNEVKYVLTQFIADQKGICTLKARLSDQAIKYLQQVSKIGSTINNDGVITQKELAGKLLAGKLDSDLTYSLDVDRSSVVSGDEEGVEIIGGLYNFHSHPQEAYSRHNVKLGWPSAQDYVGFLGSSIKHDTILHLVVSLEGFYVISLSEYWVKKKEKIDKNVVSFILEKYDYTYKPGKTSTLYARAVNGISYDGFPLFLVQFIPWYEANASFVVPFHKNGVNCFARQSTAEKYTQWTIFNGFSRYY